MPKTRLELCERQLDAIEHPARELLVGGVDAVVGRSHMLRVAGIAFGAKPASGLRIALVKRSDYELRDVHVYGRTGLMSLIGNLRRDNAVTVQANSVTFSGSSSVLRWMPCQDERDLHALLSWNPDVLLVDDVDEFPEAHYTRMAEHVLETGDPEHKKVIATTGAMDSGWLRRHWNGDSPSWRAVLEMSMEHLDGELRTAPEDALIMPFREFCELALPTMRWVRAREVMAAACEALIDGELKDREGRRIDRLMIRAPAQLGKSTMVQLLAAWWLHCNPEKTAACATYAQDKADEFSYMVREFYQQAGGRIRSDSHAVRRWHTEAGGGFWTRSVDAGAAGNPSNLLIEDDLDKSLAHALQPHHRKMVREIWYGPVWLQRWNPEHGRLIEVNIGTPHDLEDSQNYILNSPGAGEAQASRHWFMVPLQAIYDRDNFPIEVPDGTVVAEDWREKGEPLAPELPKFTLDSIERFRETMTRASFAAMMMCTPLTGQGGGVLNPAWFVPVDEDPGFTKLGENAYLRNVRAWDIGHTEGGGDRTAGSKVGRVRATARLLIRHVVCAQKAAGGVKRLMAAMMLVDGPQTVIRLPEDPSAGKSWLSDLVEYLREVCAWLEIPIPKIVGKKPKGGKLIMAERIVNRAEPPVHDAEVTESNCGMVDIYNGTWTPNLHDLVPSFAPKIEEAEAKARKGDADATRRFRELRAIADIVRAVFFDEGLARQLNIQRDQPWQDELLYEVKMFDGLPGHRDDQVDSLGDAVEESNRSGGSGAMVGVPGW